MISTRSTKRLRPLVLAIALAALLVPTARAGHQDLGVDTVLGRTLAQPVVPDAVDRYLARQQAQAVIPDAVDRYVANQQYLANQRAGSRVAAPAQSSARIEVAAKTFDWGDAAIGAAGAFALMVLAAGLTTLTGRRRNARLVRS